MAQVQVSRNVSRGQWPIPTNAGEVKVQRGVLALNATASVATDVWDVVVLPAGCVPVDLSFDSDDLDSNGSPTATVDVGLITGVPGDTVLANRTVGQQFGAALTTPQAGGFARNLVVAGNRIVAQDFPRSIGFKLNAVATAVIQNGTLTVNRGLWAPGTTYVANDYVTLANGVIMECTTGGASGTYGQTVRDAPTQKQPNWNLAFAGTTVDGTVTWTCRSPIIAATLSYRHESAGL